MGARTAQTIVTRTHGSLRRGNGPADHAAVTHRAHRPPATVPARRGMRSAWFRGRAPAETEMTDTPDAPPAPETEERAPDTAPPAIGQPGIRTAFSHPTF
jgi:hypothetical protein